MKTPTIAQPLMLRILSLAFSLIVALGFLLVPVLALTGTNSTATPTPVSLPFGLTAEEIVFVAVVLGIFARTMFPYLAKLKAAANATPAQPLSFDKTFAYTALFNLFQSAIVAALVFGQIPVTSSAGSIAQFLGAFGYSYATLDLTNQIV